VWLTALLACFHDCYKLCPTTALPAGESWYAAQYLGASKVATGTTAPLREQLARCSTFVRAVLPKYDLVTGDGLHSALSLRPEGALEPSHRSSPASELVRASFVVDPLGCLKKPRFAALLLGSVSLLWLPGNHSKLQWCATSVLSCRQDLGRCDTL